MRRARKRSGKRSRVLWPRSARQPAWPPCSPPAGPPRAPRQAGSRPGFGRRQHRHLRDVARRTGQLLWPFMLGVTTARTTASTTSTTSSTCCTGRCTGSARRTTPYLNPRSAWPSRRRTTANVVRIQLKSNYRWSNGEPVDARDVVFWMNMMIAEAQTATSKACGSNIAACKYWVGTTGDGLPSDVTHVRAASKYVVTMRHHDAEVLRELVHQ